MKIMNWFKDALHARKSTTWEIPLENPQMKRRNYRDLTHEEWLDVQRERFTKEQADPHLFWSMCSSAGICPGEDHAFHSEEEARSVLKPCGYELTYNANSGFSTDGGATFNGEWWITTETIGLLVAPEYADLIAAYLVESIKDEYPLLLLAQLTIGKMNS